jgi:RimJ/RimL family protein N-acetyltransferase
MFIELKTDRLILRPLNIEDLDTVHAYASEVENTKYMLHLPNDTIEETSDFLARATNEWKKEEPNFFEFAITLEGKQIGAVSVYLNEQRTEGELGWILNKKYWGKGYATEAAVAVKDFAVNELKVSNLVAHCDFRNTASSNVMKKIGLTLVKDDGIRQYPKTAEIARESMYSLSRP